MSVETVNYEFTRICVMLQSREKSRRMQGLTEILNILKLPHHQSDETLPLWDAVNKFVLQILNDSAEICRDRTVEIIKLFILNLTPDDKYVTYLLPILSKRLGSLEQIETSEEVRLKCVTLLKLLILKYNNLLAPYIDDLVNILTRTIVDNYPLIKRESCICVSEFAKNLPRYFYMQTEKFVKPILSNFTHQHYKVRIVSITTIGDLIQHGKSTFIENVSLPLAEKLFDQNGLVRTAVIEVAGCWLLKLKDRYSWWHKILPLLLTGLHDEFKEIREKAANFWDAAGQLYIQENDNDEKFKDKMDFLIKDPDHYPNVVRPNLGCRVIAQQTFSKLINGISLELSDWMADIRVRSAQLLCVFILNIEEGVTQHIQKLLPPIYRACNDEDNRVVENIERAAEYLGYFVHPKTCCHLILPTLQENPSAGHLRVFSAILRGFERYTLLPLLKDIGKFLQQPHICQSTKETYQKQILSCCRSLILICKEDCKLISEDLFIAIFTVLSMAKNHYMELEAKELLNVLADINCYDNVEKLYSEYIGQLISSLSDYKSWSKHSPESQIFCACLIHVKTIFTFDMDIMLSILKSVMTNDADPELRLQYFTVLSQCFNQDSSDKIIDSKLSYQFLEDCILPGLIWTVGRVAETIRTAAVSCLCAFFEKYEKDLSIENTQYFMKHNICPVLDKIIPVLISLADDNSKKSRLYSLRAMYLVICIRKRFDYLTEEHIHKIYPILLKRLDDGCDDIRLASLEALIKVWNSIPKNYDLHFNKGHIEMLYTTTVIYLDDPDSEFQNVMLENLKELARVHPELLYQKLQNCKTNFRNQEGIETLLEHCSYILRGN
ncbi:dynein axonemal assembly factor 5-like [Colletes gigas]|uniref:dynein axonemal assembly factor 5-like n=1 Tax=Colletes gigas TaxID=935657 RepID=UPI001C9B02C8|nr:dynein axonemal assembly factor 5-like [Colletes gigas]